MTTDTSQTVGAASRELGEWHAIDWQAAHENVRRLQARIVKATQEGRWGKVKALQHLLTHSFSGKAVAVKRVTENKGRRTPGVDGAIWNTPGRKMRAVDELKRRGYRPRPLRRVHIPKSNGKKRPLGIPTMKDRAMQALYLLALDPIAETTADPNSYGFRTGRACADAIQQCFLTLSRGISARWVLEGDIKSCFDRISHEWLLAHVPMDRAMLCLWLKAGYMEKHVLHPTDEGTPQGGIISPVLANLALDGLEQKLREKYPPATRKSRQAQVNLIRYADDFLITGRTKELLEEEVRPLVEAFLQERGLELSPEKTRLTSIEEGFDFLGQNLRKYNGTLLIKPSKKSVAALLGKVREVVRVNRANAAGVLILQLNPIIRGWAGYHRHVASKETFARVDNHIFQMVWRWAKRRHPNKNLHWIKDKYFGRYGGDHWRLFDQVERGGAVKTVTLYKARGVPIERHVKIQMHANPYDPQWELYFEKRLGVKMKGDLRHRRQLLFLWTRQRGTCPVCGQKLTSLTKWHSHHRVWRILGGSDKAENRVLLHSNCHRQVHSSPGSVVWPRLARGVGKA